MTEESPSFTTHYIKEIILTNNLMVSIYALLLSFQIPRQARNDKEECNKENTPCILKTNTVKCKVLNNYTQTVVLWIGQKLL